MKKNSNLYIFILFSLFILFLSNIINPNLLTNSKLKKTKNENNISNSLELSNLFFNCIKNNIINESNNLCDIDYYTKALNFIDYSSSILIEDNDILSLKKSIEDKKSEYLSSNSNSSITTSSSILNAISIATINSLSIESLTPYLIHVDITNQKTYIYEGSKNKWNLIKSFICSTGIKGEDTPSGIYTIKERGKWFFSEKYNQGGRYWVQFFDDYLFHSIPYNKEQTQIVDNTLGIPSSHGCIRLSEEDSKWIYYNIPSGSKVIIK